MRRTRIYRIGKLEIMRTDDLLIDWRLREPGKRWRIQVGIDRLWFPMYGAEPTWRGNLYRIHLAFWGIGNDT